MGITKNIYVWASLKPNSEIIIEMVTNGKGRGDQSS